MCGYKDTYMVTHLIATFMLPDISGQIDLTSVCQKPDIPKKEYLGEKGLSRESRKDVTELCSSFA